MITLWVFFKFTKKRGTGSAPVRNSGANGPTKVTFESPEFKEELTEINSVVEKCGLNDLEQQTQTKYDVKFVLK